MESSPKPPSRPLRLLGSYLGVLLEARNGETLPAGISPDKDSATHEFLLAEYDSLTRLVNARDERVDRFLTIYLALAGAPFLLYAALLRDHSLPTELADMPPLVALAMIFISLAGYALLKIVVQLRFSTLLYIRAMNGVRRSYAAGNRIGKGLLLPEDPRYPAYCEGPRWRQKNGALEGEARKYMFEIVAAMAFVNATYLGLGLRCLPHISVTAMASLCHRSLDWLGPSSIAIVYLLVQVHYYFRAAKMREDKGREPGRI